MKNLSQSGRTMIEVLAVLSLIGILVSSILGMINSMYDKFKSSEILSEIRDLRKGINGRYAATGDYTDISAKILIDERLAPSQMVNGQRLLHAYQGEVKFSPGNTGGKNRSYKISFPVLPYKNCLELATLNWDIDSTATLVSITINKTTFSWPVNKVSSGGVTQSNAATSLPMDYSKAATACTKDKNNEIIWEFQ